MSVTTVMMISDDEASITVSENGAPLTEISYSEGSVTLSERGNATLTLEDHNKIIDGLQKWASLINSKFSPPSGYEPYKIEMDCDYNKYEYKFRVGETNLKFKWDIDNEELTAFPRPEVTMLFQTWSKYLAMHAWLQRQIEA